MPKHRIEKFKHKTYNLSDSTVYKLEELSKFEGLNKSEFIEFLIENWNTGINPTDRLTKILDERKNLSKKLLELDNQIEELNKQIKTFEEWKKIKQSKQNTAIQVIKRKILERDFEGAELISKTWQRITGVSALILLTKAQEELKNDL